MIGQSGRLLREKLQQHFEGVSAHAFTMMSEPQRNQSGEPGAEIPGANRRLFEPCTKWLSLVSNFLFTCDLAEPGTQNPGQGDAGPEPLPFVPFADNVQVHF